MLHFGLRVGDRYVDPMQLFRPVDLTKLVHLVPADDPDERPWSLPPRAPSSGLVAAPVAGGIARAAADATSDDGCGDDVPLIGGFISDACAVAGWIGDPRGGGARLRSPLPPRGHRHQQRVLRRLRSAVRDGRSPARAPRRVRSGPRAHPPGELVVDLVDIGRRFVDTITSECDGDAPAADGTGGSGHRVMVVAGINSSGGAWDSPTVGLDVKALGYYRDEGEIRYFSYAADGGAYTKADTLGDLDRAAHQLLEQLRAMRREQPGREVDLVGHSQGGVVIDIFLSKYYDPADPTLPPLGDVITLSSPHEGAPLATAAAQIRSKASGRVILDDLVGDNVSLVPSLSSVAVGQLTEASPTIKNLFPRGLPEHVNFTTIGADTDYVVPATNISVPGATETVIGGDLLDSANEHSAIVSDPDALRAVRSALEGRPPPCVSIATALRARWCRSSSAGSSTISETSGARSCREPPQPLKPFRDPPLHFLSTRSLIGITHARRSQVHRCLHPSLHQVPAGGGTTEE